ncbi:MAG: restriction endonuclease subunit S [Streptococcus mitis]|nr:restriction endonuclease subunit S [Streptococcus mitis]
MNILEEIPNCPVEWKELGEVAHSIKTGLNPRKFFQLNTSDASNYYITVREIRGHKIVPSEKTDLINNDGLMLCQNRSNLEIGDVLFTGTGTIGNVAIIEKTPTNWNIKEGVYAIKPKKEQICSKFLMYLFESEKIRKDIEGRKAGGTVKSVSMAEMKKIKIPIPPLEIQEKIVQTLDKFTDYVTELTSELTSRKKQYSFYRDKLLSFEDEVYQVEWKTLDAVSERTSNISWNKIGDDEKFKYIDLSSVDRVSNKITETTSITKSTAPSRAQKIVKSNDIILGTTRPTLKRFTKITDDYNDQICSTGFYVFRTNGEVLPNYVYHIFSSSDFYKYLEENQSGASYPAISDALVKKYKIPVPSLEIQSRIVQVLDNFDMVCNDLNIGLPKEIELRQKQYEYFREKLLTFVAEGEYTESRVE